MLDSSTSNKTITTITPFKVRCKKCSNIWTTTLNKWRAGCRCPVCAKSLPLLDEFVNNEFARENYIKFTPYINANTKFQAQCPKGHKFSTTWSRWYLGNRCAKCHISSKASKAEKEIAEFIKGLGFECVENDRTILKPKEIDIFVPSKNIGFEYNGLIKAWYDEKNKKAEKFRKYRYALKYELAKAKNVKLINIFEDEWVVRQIAVKARIMSLLDANNKIVTRNTEIKRVSYRDIRDFTELYHIQGAAKFKIGFGIFYKNELLEVMTFRRNKDSLILNRYCAKEGVTVQGGASELFKHGVLWAVENNFYKIFSYADLRWADDSLYNTLGFVLDRTIPPRYSYAVLRKKVTRYSKRVLKRITGKTEKELRTEQGYYRIYDCGKQRWVYHL